MPSLQLTEPILGSSTHTPLSAVVHLVTFPKNHSAYVPKLSVLQPHRLQGVPQVAMLSHAPPMPLYGDGSGTSRMQTQAPLTDTQQLNAGLTQAINRPKGRSGMKPPVFEGVGNDNIEVWLDHIGRLCRLDNLDERDMMEYIPCWLDPDVAVFLDIRTKAEAAVNRYVDWATKKRFLIERYRFHLREVQATQKATARVWLPTNTVESYHTDFMKYFDLMGSLRYPASHPHDKRFENGTEMAFYDGMLRTRRCD